MASGPPQSCCASGMKHEGEYVGELKKVGGITSYVSFPPDKKTDHAILYIPDAMGIQLNNSKLLCDDLARAGYFVVAPDVFASDPIPESLLNAEGRLAGAFDWPAWLQKHTVKDVEPILDAAIKAMKSEYGVKHLGAVGYCFGGKYVVRYLAAGRGVEAGFVAHPSLVEAGELEAIAGPLSIAAAEIDQIMPPEKRRETEEILLGKEKRVPFQITLYSDVEHGFAVRTDLSDRKKKFAKESAYVQAVRWFDEWLKT